METGLVNKWIMVHDGEKCYLAQHNENQTTASSHTIEQFETEEEMDARLVELGMERPSTGEDEETEVEEDLE